MITFTSNKVTPAKGDWGGIVFQPTAIGTTSNVFGYYASGSIIEYCEISYGMGIQNNNPINLWINYSKILNNGASGISNGGNSKITNNTISGNSSYYYSNDTYFASYFSGGGIYNTGNSTISNNTISENSSSFVGRESTAHYSGGGIYNTGNSTISNNTISENSSSFWSGIAASGGGIYNTAGWTISNNTISGNSSTPSGDSGYYSLQGSFVSGGGICNTGNSTVINNIINNNTSSATGPFSVASGGGIYNTAGQTISNNTISGNSASAVSGNWPIPFSSGGGIYSTCFMAAIMGNTITNNTSSGSDSGGGIYDTGHSTIANNIISSNSSSAYYSGGGIYNTSSSIITGNKIKNNFTKYNGNVNGSAIRTGDQSTIEGNDIICNSALNGIQSGALHRCTGNNLINPTATYEFYYTGASDLSSPDNYWGTTNTIDLFNRIYDYWHDVTLGKVNYTPLAATPFDGLSANGGCDVNADFAGIPVQGYAPMLVSFVDLSSDHPTSWQWTFGDSSTSTQQNPTHVYKNSGTYNVSLSMVGASVVFHK